MTSHSETTRRPSAAGIAARPARVPAHLASPWSAPGVRTHGRLDLDVPAKGARHYIIEAAPYVLELAKRVFPGSQSTVRGGYVRFPVTRRGAEDLNWFLLRFPLDLSPAAKRQLTRDRKDAIAHAALRDECLRLPPTTPPASFLGTLLPFQAEDVALMLAYQRTLLTWDTGTGKSIGALSALVTGNLFPALIVRPPQLGRHWTTKIGEFLDLQPSAQGELRLPGEMTQDEVLARGARISHNIKGLTPYALPDVPIHHIHYGLLRGWRDVLPAYGYKCVIFDEAHELRHTGTEKYSVASLLSSAAEYVFGLTATPIWNYGAEVWSVLNAVSFQCLGDKESFTREWCTGYNAERVANPGLLGEYLRREGLMLRRRIEDIGLQLPRVRNVVQMVGKDDLRYQTAIQEAVRIAHRYDKLTTWHERGQARAQIDEISRRATGEAKAPEVAAFVRGLVASGERVLLFAHHHTVHAYLAEALADLGVVRHTGHESQAQKDDAIDAFSSGASPVILLALRTTAGLDGLQGRGTCCVFAELDWAPAVHTQCTGRLRRIGVAEGVQSILAFYMVTDTGSDETQREALGLKLEQFVGLMGDRPESEEDRALASRAAEDQLDKVIRALQAIPLSATAPSEQEAVVA